MRTIKFRGKRTDDGEWVYGDLFQPLGHYPIIINTEPDNKGKVAYIRTGVQKETVGQFTGLTDKNGKAIYEGDIVQSKLKRLRKYDEILQICFANSEYCGKDKYGSSTSLSLLEEYHTLEVIGNIHDNPELINGNYKEEEE